MTGGTWLKTSSDRASRASGTRGTVTGLTELVDNVRRVAGCTVWVEGVLGEGAGVAVGD